MRDIINKVKSAPDIYQVFSDFLQVDAPPVPQLISFINPYSYMVLRDKNDYYSSVDYYYSDAISSSLIFSALFRRKIPRVSFDYGSFGLVFLKKIAAAGDSVFFIGAKQDEIEQTVHIFKGTYSGLNVAGFRHGYFSNSDQAAAVADQIVASGAKFVVCGMGTPHQEMFGRLLKQKGLGVISQIYTCGGFLHQSKTDICYYPKFINRFHLRWLYRAINEQHVLRRLLIQYPQFLLYVFYDFFSK